VLGRIGISASPAQRGRVWAIVEAKDGAVLRSDDFGESWQRVNEGGEVRQRPWYYMHIFAHPTEPETVWILNLSAWKSTDGGKTFNRVFFPHDDHHDLWIDPRNPQRMVEASDGGGSVSFNGGASWSTIYNQPTVEFYHVSADDQVPYRLYGAQQDNSTISVPSRSNTAAIMVTDTYEVGGGESGYIAVKPGNPDIIFAGNFAGTITRFDRRTGQRQNIAAWPEESAGWGEKDIKYRFQWTFPIVISPHDPDVLYITSQHVHRSTNEGMSWDVISPDLTRNDPTKMEPSGGPVTIDSNGMDYYCTIFAFAESPLRRGVLWAGSDDGLVHLSRDGGITWDDVTPPGLPTWSLVSIIEASPHDAGTAYLAIDRHRHDDFAPYLYKTADYGRTWATITHGIPEDDFCRVIREDPNRRGLLYCGTETGVYVSFDDGGQWQRFNLNLPVVPVHDLLVKDGDLVAGTHGRGFWIMDDVSPLRDGGSGRWTVDGGQKTVDGERSTVHSPLPTAYLYAPRPAIRYRTQNGFAQPGGPGKSYQMVGTLQYTTRQFERLDGTKGYRFLDAGQNPPDGATIYYHLPEGVEGEISLTILEAGGDEIKRFKPKPESPAKDDTGPWLATDPGLNRFVWNMRYPDARNVPGAIYRSAGVTGPLAPPGEYRVRLTVGEGSWEQPLVLRKDPRVAASDNDLHEQFALLIEIRDRLSETNDAIIKLRALREQVENGEAVVAAGKALRESLSEVEEELVQTRWKSSRDALTAPSKLNVRLATLLGVVGGADARPTQQARDVFASVDERVDVQLMRLAALVEGEVPRFNALVKEMDLPALG
jgi:photosystem II stability/assembly factor-like uncharacterized protein